MTTRTVSQVLNVLVDRVRWGPMWVGLFAVFFTLLVLNLLGIAIGASTMNVGPTAQGAGNQIAGSYSTIWAGISAIPAFLIGGDVAGRTAVQERGRAAPNGALVFLLALPLLPWLASQSLAALIGNANHIAGGLGIDTGQLDSTTTEVARNRMPQRAQQAADTARNTAWRTLIGLLLGGTLGMRHAARDTHAMGIAVYAGCLR